MTDRSPLVEAAPHYLAAILSMVLALAITRAVAGSVGFEVEVVVAVTVGTAYFFVVRWLGIAPRMWTGEA